MDEDPLLDDLGRYSRGELTSRMVMERTGLEYGEVLEALGARGLRLPRPNFDGVNGPALRRGVDFVVAMLGGETAR